MLKILSRWQAWWATRNQTLLPILFADTAPLDLRIVGRTVFHAALVGLAAGLVGAAFFGSLEYVQRFLLEELAGYIPLRAYGEAFVAKEGSHVFRPWLLVVLPTLGGLACGLLTQLAPETRGGGGDATIEAYHHHRGIIRRRVIWVKALASIFTLGTGGAGGREGPTMQIGGALGSFVARSLNIGIRERRVLLVAGIAAGISAVFRTPLGAALLAVEILYRDGFESDALIPSVLASVVSYSVVISIYGETTLLSHSSRFPFVPAHLPLYGLLALFIAFLAAGFVAMLRRSRKTFAALPLPPWARPAVGGLALGVFCTPVIMLVGAMTNTQGRGLGLLGGGYGAVQMAISGSSWLPTEWGAVQLLLLLSLAKLFAASLTIGSGGSAGDFAPSLAIGGLFGGAFGRAVQLLLDDPRIDPGAFALIGMSVFFGGIAHVPLSALVITCELAGNYDLLVPLMLAQAIAFVALRKRAIYESQVSTPGDSPVHRDQFLAEALKTIRVKDLMTQGESFVCFAASTSASEMIRHIGEATWQDVFPVVDAHNKMIGLVNADAIRVLSGEGKDVLWALAADVMQPLVCVHPEDDLCKATQCIVANGLREIPVVDQDLRVIGFLDEREVAKMYLQSEESSEEPRETARSRRRLP